MGISTNMLLNGNVNDIAAMFRASQATGRSRTTSTAYSASNARYGINNYYGRQAASYTTIGTAAESLRSTAAAFTSQNENNVFAAAKRSGSTDGLLSQAKSMVTSYNNTIKGLSSNQTSLNRVYGQMMKNAASENRDALKGIGITVNRDNTISIDEKKFKGAGVDEIEKVLGAGSKFSSRMESVSGNVADNAIRNASSYSMQYGRNGLYNAGGLYGSNGGYSTNSAYLSALLATGSRFNFWS